MTRVIVSALVALSAAAASAPAGPLAGSPARTYEGVIEGFYGVPWSHRARLGMIRWLGRNGLDTYVYAPKEDPYHRDRWREPYPSGELSRFRELVVAGRGRVRVVYGIAPGLNMCYSAAADRDDLSAKLDQLASAGIRVFLLAFDDVARTFHCASDVQRYVDVGRGLGRAHKDVVNETLRRLRSRFVGVRVIVVPTDYAEAGPTPYLSGLIPGLERTVDVAWTGPYAVAARITAPQARTIARIYGRQPVLWDNYPVNDYSPRRLHLGPFAGRDPALPRQLAGYLANPMNQPEASKLPLATLARYLRAPTRYQPQAAWRAVIGTGGVRVLADHSARTGTLDDPRPLWAVDVPLLRPALARFARSVSGPAWRQPAAELGRQLEARASLQLAEGPLAAEVVPWVARVRADSATAVTALRVIRMSRPALRVTRRGARVRGRVTVASGGTVAAAVRHLESAWHATERMQALTHAGMVRFLVALAQLHAQCHSGAVRVFVGGRRVRVGPDGRFSAARRGPVVARAAGGLATGAGPTPPRSDVAIRRRVEAYARAVRAERLEGLGAMYDADFRSIHGTRRADEIAGWRALLDASTIRHALFRTELVARGPGSCRRHSAVWVDWVVAGRLPPYAPSGEDGGTLGKASGFLFRDNRIVYGVG